jgi:DNA-binding transcriptional LysR family regulator
VPSAKSRKFDLNLLPIAVAILHARSVTKAAEKLNMSQPAVSAALRKLRTVFDDQLFVKSARGVEPTPKALALIPAASLILSRVEQDLFSELSFDPLEYKDNFTLGLTQVGELLYLPIIIRSLKRLAPQAAVRSFPVMRNELPHILRDGKVDLVIGAYSEFSAKNVHQRTLFTGGFACLVRADHPVRKREISREEFRGLEHVIVRTQDQILASIWEDQEAHSRIRLVASNWLCLPRVIATSDLAVVVPLHLAVYYCRLMKNLRIIALPPGFPTFSVNQYWHVRFHDEPRNKWFRTLVGNLLSGEPGSAVRMIMGLVRQSTGKHRK